MTMFNAPCNGFEMKKFSRNDKIAAWSKDTSPRFVSHHPTETPLTI